MNGFALTAAGTVLAALLGGLFLIAAQRITSRANTRVEAEKLDLARFEAFEARSDAAIERNDKRIADLEHALAEEKAMREAADERAQAAERRAQQAERRADEAERKATAATRRLLRRVEQLEQVLRDNDMDVPPAEGEL